MKNCAIYGVFLLMNIQGAHCFAQLDSNHGQEPQCGSQFDYEYKVVQKIVALENLCDGQKTTNSELRAEVSDVQAETQTTKAEIQTALNEVKVEIQTITNEIENLKSKTTGKHKCKQ